MTLTVLIIVLVGIGLATGGFIWFMLSPRKPKEVQVDYATMAETDVEHIFNDEFREELRNRGRLHFEKIIGENAMFLQQDLRLTTSQLNDFMKQEIIKTLKEEFSRYEESINDAKQLAIDSIQKTQATIEEQRVVLTEQIEKQLSTEKARQLARFEKHMAEIVNHYVLQAIGDQIDLSDQLDFILADMEENKEAIVRDVADGA
ncbi:MAG: hypothetical protein M3Q70_03955 [bacterium]|nr:hypothetical protein [bacterium]